MSISEEDARHVARLANLELTPEESERMVVDLNAVLEYATRLEALGDLDPDPQTDDVPPNLGGRPDTVEPWLQPGEAVSIAPDSKNGLFRVPPALGG